MQDMINIDRDFYKKCVKKSLASKKKVIKKNLEKRSRKSMSLGIARSRDKKS